MLFQWRRQTAKYKNMTDLKQADRNGNDHNA